MSVTSTASPSVTEVPPERFGKALEFIEEMTTNTDQVQQKVLGEILSLNGDAEYLRNFNLGRWIDRNTFKSRVPIVSHDDLQPFIHRIANGDCSPILTSHPVTEFLTSSGTSTTTGERKLIPMTRHEMDLRRQFVSLSMPIMNLYVQGLDKGKALNFIVLKAETKTPSGLRASSFTTSHFKSEYFINRPFDPYHDLTSPDEAILCHDYFQSLYTQMLCGLLMRRQILRIGAIFASTLLHTIKFFQLEWPQLAHDIAVGSLNPKITDQSIRDRMAKILQPDPHLAEFITRECEAGNWEGIITRIWPNAKYLDAVVTGSMAQYVPQLDFYSGGLPKASTMYVSSEACVGINLNPMARPEDVSYTIMPNMGYFEFISTESSEENAVDLADVEIGREYELIVTTYAGLCRYRIGDILRVTGFHNSAPQFKYVRRKNVILSIDVDKTNEAELQTAVEKAASLLNKYNTSMVEYTSYADTNSIPGHYVVYWELGVKDPANAPGLDVLAKCCLTMEESLSAVYRECRHRHSVAPLEIRIVKGGTFGKVMDHAISSGTAMNQYKTPRCVRSSSLINLLDVHIESVHFSPTEPYWTSERRL